MKKPLAADLVVVSRVPGLVDRLRAELEAIEPVLARLEEIRYPSAAMARYDLAETLERCGELGESIMALRFGLEVAPLDQEGLAY